MLSLGEHFFYLHEPFNNRMRRRYPAVYGRPFAYFYPYLRPADQGAPGMSEFMAWAVGGPEPACWQQAGKTSWSGDELTHLEELRQARGQGRAALIKDPVAVLALEWVMARHELPVLAMVRHPAEFVRSVMQLEWHVGPGFFLQQEAFMATLPHDLAGRIEALHGSRDRLRKAALMWTVMNYHIHRVAAGANGRIRMVRHEDLAADPRQGFSGLLTAMGIADDIRPEEIAEWSGPHNPAQPRALWVIKRDSRGNYGRWREWFSPNQIEAIREIAEPLSRELGYEFDSREGT